MENGKPTLATPHIYVAPEHGKWKPDIGFILLQEKLCVFFPHPAISIASHSSPKNYLLFIITITCVYPAGQASPKSQMRKDTENDRYFKK